MNQVLNLLKAEDDIVHFVAFIKCSRLSRVGIYSTLFLQPTEPILLEMIITCLISF